jgi:hypothetical protein
VALPSKLVVPAGHNWQVVDTPSTKNCPATQHADVVADVHRFVPEPQVDVQVTGVLPLK